MGLLTRLKRLPYQLLGESPFRGTYPARRLSIVATALVTARHFRTPLRILDHVFRDGEAVKYLDVPGLPPILFIRDPEIIRTITVETANHGAFDRDTLPTQGIARVVGGLNLLFAQGEVWRKHRAAAARPFGMGAVQTPEVFHGMEKLIKKAVEPQIEVIAERVRRSGTNRCRMQLEPHIKALMLTVLVNVLFGSPIPHDELQTRYLPAIENVISYILLDTVTNQLRLPTFRLPTITAGHARLKEDRQVFEELVERVIRTRSEGAGFWPLLTVGGPEEAVRSNVRVFLAGALEATASYLSWTLGNLARHPEVQAKAHREAAALTELGAAGAGECHLLAAGVVRELATQQCPVLSAAGRTQGHDHRNDAGDARNTGRHPYRVGNLPRGSLRAALGSGRHRAPGHGVRTRSMGRGQHGDPRPVVEGQLAFRVRAWTPGLHREAFQRGRGVRVRDAVPSPVRVPSGACEHRCRLWRVHPPQGQGGCGTIAPLLRSTRCPADATRGRNTKWGVRRKPTLNLPAPVDRLSSGSVPAAASLRRL